MNNIIFKTTRMQSLIKSNVLFNVTKKIYQPHSYALIEKLGSLSLHTTSKLGRFSPSRPPPEEFNEPVDWLPFPWQRRQRFNLYENSGDYITDIPINPDDPKPNFELSEELKTADEQVRRSFTLATCSKQDAKEVMKKQLLERIQRHPYDYSSLEVRIALMTVQIRSLYVHHSKLWRKEPLFSRKVLPIIIQKRNKLLKKLWLIDEARYQFVLKELQLYHTPPKMGWNYERYTRKWDLRRLTREYCEKKIAEKKAAYHAELKKEQEAFLEEKKQALAWIEEEERALKSDVAVQ